MLPACPGCFSGAARRIRRTALLLGTPLLAAACQGARRADAPAAVAAPVSPPPPAAQNPSPMVERTRTHGRLQETPATGTRLTLTGILSRPVELWLPPGLDAARETSLLVHFLGAAFIPIQSAQRVDPHLVVAAVTLTPGSAAYEAPFAGTDAWARLLRAIDSTVAGETGRTLPRKATVLSAFSAGNGAVRAIIADSAQAAAIDGIIILDGIHTSYDPPRRVVAEGGRLAEGVLLSLERYARRALRGEVAMVVTHSEVFPGTFASTTETANWLVERLSLQRHAVLAWGPNGMQQTSEARAGRFQLLGFAGNSAPDHLDHLHALPWWLGDLFRR